LNAASVVVRQDDLHASLLNPLLDAMNFLGEIAARHPEAVSFAAGRPAEQYFRTEDVITHLRAYLDHLERHEYTPERIRTEIFQYGPTAGQIRGLIAGHLAAEEGIAVPPEAIVVTVGAQEAMLLALRALFASPDDVLLVAAPCYVGITGAAALLDIPVIAVPWSGPGLERVLAAVASQQYALGRRPRAFYLTPDHSNPTGQTLTDAEREALLEAAEDADLLVIEDSPYRMFGAGQPLRTLKARERGGRVVYIGSFSKTALPGARVGYVVADQPVSGGAGLLAAELTKVKSMVTVNTPTLSQAVVGGLLVANDMRLGPVNSPARDHYLSNAGYLLAALDKHFPAEERERLGVSWNVPDGGFFLTLRVGFDAGDPALRRSAEEFGVLWTPQSYFQPGGDLRAIRLAYSNLTPDLIDEGIARLAAFIDAMSSVSPPPGGPAPVATGRPWTPSARAVAQDYLTLIDDSCVAVLPHALRTFVDLGLVEALPGTVDELATAVDAHPGHLGRLLRALGTTGLITGDAGAQWSLTTRGRELLTVGGTARSGLVNVDSAIAWLGATEAVRRGDDAFSTAHEHSFFGHKDAGQDANVRFLTRMRERARRCYADLVAQIDWRSSTTVLDIGGGDGYLLDRILTAAPHVRGILFDRPAGTALAAPHLSPWGDRCSIAAGDFFEALPPGADTHVLASVLHDWTDDQAETILRHSRSSLAAGGRLYVLEMLVPQDGTDHPSLWSDLGMMLLTGGLERTRSEFRDLLTRSGYDQVTATPVQGSWFSLIEAR
jgi:(S)-3,5-dihydroxyphenylglycine transaminase